MGRENSKLNLEGKSLEIDKAAFRGLELHHPIMNKIGGLGKSNRQTDSNDNEAKNGMGYISEEARSEKYLYLKLLFMMCYCMDTHQSSL